VEVAAVELINVLRPTVANARYMVFIAMALQAHPEWRERLRAGDTDLEPFVHEVRRFYPFIPFIGGRVLQEFEWRGYRFAKDTWTLIDLYGTNRDPRSWDEPDAFRPERFKNRSIGPFEFIPSGGGDHPTTHRCPGEWITIEQMKTVARLLDAGDALHGARAGPPHRPRPHAGPAEEPLRDDGCAFGRLRVSTAAERVTASLSAGL
jgi:fatty-acid peroxygenase